jgi:hypothetical protein
MKNYIILFLFLFSSLNLFSQQRGQWNGGAGNFQMSNMTVKGRLLDSETMDGLSFASISIFTSDSILVSGGISEENGRFKIEIDPKKMMEKIKEKRSIQTENKRRGMSLFAEISYVGYENKNIALPFDLQNREISINDVLLVADATNLDDVTVRAE